MAVKDRVSIELIVDDQGTVKIVQARKAVEDLGAAGQQSMSNAAGGADEFAGALTRQLGIYALATAAAYGLERAIVGGFKSGLQAVDDYRLATIGVAGTLTDLAQDSGDSQKTYNQALAYAQGMYGELELAAAKYFASGKDMTQAWNILAQKGVVLRHGEIDALGIIVDRIELSTQGQVGSLQIAQEMRSIITGQARATDQVGMLLKDRIPNLEAELAKHRQIGDVVTWLAAQFKGLGLASEDIQGTLESQKSTLDTLLTQVGRAGLTGAYEDTVSWLAQANQYLVTHREEIGGGIQAGWRAVKDLAEGTAGAVQIIAKIGEVGIVIPIKYVVSVSGPEGFLNLGMQGGTYSATGFWPGQQHTATIEPTADFGLGGGSWSKIVREQLDNQQQQTQEGIKKYFTDTTATFIEEQNQQNQAIRANVEKRLPGITALSGAAESKKYFSVGQTSLGVPDLPDFWRSGVPQVKPPAPAAKGGGGGGGGKGLESAERQLENYINRLESVSAKAQGLLFSGLEEWADKESLTLKRIEEQLGVSLEARAALQTAYNAKREKLLDDFSGKEMKRLQAQQASFEKGWLGSLELEKGLYDQMAQLSPVLSDQVEWKRKALDLEIQSNQYAFEKKLLELETAHIIEKAQADQLRGLKALENQQRRTNFKLENDQGLSGWAYGRGKEADQRSTVKDMMGGLESGFQNAFASGLQGVLTQEKVTLKKIGSTMFQGLVGEINKGSITRMFDAGAKMLRPQQGLKGTGNAAGELGEAAKGLAELPPKFDANAAQFGLAAGGLLLSGIGIATNSQFLVMAGTVLQVAGLAIQVYQALAGMTQMSAAAALTGSATALGVAATALTYAAAADSIPFLHSGGQIAHSGLLVAHNGLGSDERLIIAQTGEGILKRSAMRAYADMGIGFDDLNNGRLPAVPLPVPVGGSGGGGRPQAVNYDYSDHSTVTLNPTIIISQKITRGEADRLWADILEPAYERRKKNRVKVGKR